MKKLWVIASLVLPVALIVLFFILPHIIKISSLVCRSQYGPCNSEIDKKLDSLNGNSLYQVKRSIKEYFKKEPLVSAYSFQLKLPSTLQVYLIENKVYFSVTDKERKTFALTDKEGKVIKLQNTNNLPFLVVEATPPAIGETIKPEYLFALNLIYTLNSSYQVDSGTITGDSLEVNLPSGMKVVFPLEGDHDTLIGSLSLILTKLNDEAKDSNIKVSIIDLRFKNPVLK